MAAHNRHLRGETNDVLGYVKGNIVVEAGDFMSRNAVEGHMGIERAADHYAYPFSEIKNITGPDMHVVKYTYFLGVAMEGSPSGVTGDITIATTGVFKYPMHTDNGVTIGALVSAVSSHAGTGGCSPQTVWNLASHPGSTAYLGFITKTESGASFVEFNLCTNLGVGRAT